jgi:hypothetical protein
MRDESAQCGKIKPSVDVMYEARSTNGTERISAQTSGNQVYEILAPKHFGIDQRHNSDGTMD